MPETIRIGADQARAKLRDLLDGIRAKGDVVEITRWNRTEAVLMAPPPEGMKYELVKDEGEKMETKYIAALGMTKDVALNGFCDVEVVEADEHFSSFGAKYEAGDRVVMSLTDTKVRADDPDSMVKAPPAADEILSARGWSRTGDWEISDNAMYAPVEKA